MCGCKGDARECLLARLTGMVRSAADGSLVKSGPRPVCGCDCHRDREREAQADRDYDLQEYRSALRRMAAKIAGGISASDINVRDNQTATEVAKASIRIAKTIIDQVAKVDEVPDHWREQA